MGAQAVQRISWNQEGERRFCRMSIRLLPATKESSRENKGRIEAMATTAQQLLLVLAADAQLFQRTFVSRASRE